MRREDGRGATRDNTREKSSLTTVDICIGGGGKGKLSDIENKLTVSAFARRRLPVVMTRLKMGETVQAVRYFSIYSVLFYFLGWLSPVAFPL